MLIRTRPSLDTTFEQLTHSLFAPAAIPATATPVDARWHDGSLVLTVDLPGTPDEAIAVDVAGRQLTIAVTGERPWQRTVRLGAALDPEQVDARYLHGRLTVTVAPAAAAASRSISVSTTPAPAIEASTTDAPTQDETGTNDSE